MERAADNKRVIDVVSDIAEYFVMHDGSKASPRALLERFLFEPGQQNVYVSQLSGGEKRRLYLLTVLLKNPNFLILDEPTNDLDILTLNILEEFLLNFEGCLVMVTHDRYFMDKLVDHLWILDGKGNLKDYNGNYTIYQQTLKEEKQQAAAENTNKTAAAKKSDNDRPKKLSYNEQKEFQQLEKDIAKLESERKELTEKFNLPNLTGNDFKDINTRLTTIQELLDEKEMRWMELAEFAV
jgi:ABC transport system ATP-binding/permease protein